MATLKPLEYYPAYTNAYTKAVSEGGGGDSITAVNKSSSEYSVDDKVLVQEGKEAGVEFNKSIGSATSSKIYPQGFIDNNTILGSFKGRENRRFQYVDGVWKEEVLKAYSYNDTYSFFWVNDDGSIYTKPYLPGNQSSYLVTTEGTVLGKNNWDYL